MNRNKSSNGWILCSSKSYPGKYYYFNVLNGETAWTLTETEVEKTKKQVYSNYPEPISKPPEETPLHNTSHSHNTCHSHPKTPFVPPLGSKQPTPSFGEAVFPVFVPTKDILKYVWAPVPIMYINNGNIPNLEVQEQNTSLVKLFNEKNHSIDDNNHITVQVHTCNDQYVSKRFVSFNKILNSYENNQNNDKNANENPFRMSTPIQNTVQPKLSISFNKNASQFQNEITNTFPLTKTTKNNKNKYIKNTSFIFQSKNNNSNLQPPSNEANTFREVIENNVFVTPKKTTFGYGFDTLNEKTTTHRFDTSNETTYKCNTPNKIFCGFEAPKETTPGCSTLGFGFNTLNETFKSNLPNKTILCSSNTLNTSFASDIPERAIYTLNETSFGIDTPNKTTCGFDTPNKTIIQDIQAKIPERLNNLDEDDLRHILLQRKRKNENSSNNDENAKKIKTSYSERQATPKKHVTFKLDTSDIESSSDFSSKDDQVLETPTSPAVESISSLRRLGATDGIWYIAIDLDVLLQSFDCIDAFVKTDPQCRLMVPYSVYKELTTTCTACGEHRRVNAARVVLRRLESCHPKHRVQNEVNELEKLKSQKDQIQCCCLELIKYNIHVVLITNNDILYKEAKEKKIHVFKMIQIQNGAPKTPDVTFDIQKIRYKTPNDNGVQNSKENKVVNSKKQSGCDQNVVNDNHEQKTDEKYKNSVQNFWRSDNSDSCDLTAVRQQLNKLELIEVPSLFENELKKRQLTPKKQNQNVETISPSSLKKTVVNEIFKKPLNNVVITKNVMVLHSATKKSQTDIEKENLFSVFVTSDSKKTKNQGNDKQYKKLVKKPVTNVVITKNVLQNGSATKKSQTNSEKEVVFPINVTSSSKKTQTNQGNDNQYSFSKKYKNSKDIENFDTENWKSAFSQEKHMSIFENPASIESGDYENANQYSSFESKVSKKTDTYSNEKQNSIFEINSNFMPLTSKTIEDYLKKFDLKSKMVEDSLKNSGDEKICCLRQILENLSDVLQKSSTRREISQACVLYNILQKIRKMYGKHELIGDVIEKLQALLYRSGCVDKMRYDLLPAEIMQAIGCGMLLVQLLKELKPTSEHLTDIQKGLNELIKSIDDPVIIDFGNLDFPVICKSDNNCENRFNFVKEESEIIEYLKKHYPAWRHFDGTNGSVKERKKREIKIFRTFGKDLNKFKLNKSRVFMEKANKKIESNAEPNSIQSNEYDRAKMKNTERDGQTVSKNEEKNDKIPNSNEKKVKNMAMSKFFENFDKESELKSLNTENTEKICLRFLTSDKARENTNVEWKKIMFNLKNIDNDLKKNKGLKNTEAAKDIRLFANDKRGDIELKDTDFASKKTDFDKHENTFGATESDAKIVRNIAVIPKYEDLFKKSVQNGHIMKKTVQNRLRDFETAFADTENQVNGEIFLGNPKYKTNHENDSRILKTETDNSVIKIETVCSSVLDKIDSFSSTMKNYTVFNITSNNMKDRGINIESLMVYISVFFKVIKNCFRSILHDFILKNNGKTENNSKKTSTEKKARKLRKHVIQIREKLILHSEAKVKNTMFYFFNKVMKTSEGKSNEIFFTQSRHVLFWLINQAKNLDKMLLHLSNRKETDPVFENLSK